jgi:hypothetical protein
MIYYHIFGTAREKSLNGSQDNPIFWRTGIPISWDKEPTLKLVGGINLFGQFWKIISKYGQQVSIFSIPENQYNSRYTGSIADTIPLERTSKNYTYSGTVSEPKKLAYDVTVIDIIRVINQTDFPDDPYPVNIPEFPIIPDKDYQTEIQFSNSLLENTEGAEQRIVEWSSPIRVFNLARAALQSDDLNTILDFHEEMKGSKKDFLYRDLSDYQVKGIYEWLIYCRLSNDIVNSMRPVDTVDGTFLYCAFDINNSGFDRTP